MRQRVGVRTKNAACVRRATLFEWALAHEMTHEPTPGLLCTFALAASAASGCGAQAAPPAEPPRVEATGTATASGRSESKERVGAGSIEVEALPRSDRGWLACSLFASSDGFPGRAEAAISRVVAKIEAGRALCRFEHVVPGDYAIAILHDENENGRMDTNLFGMPVEGWGASNDAPPGLVSGPSWDDARLSFAGGVQKLRLRLRY